MRHYSFTIRLNTIPYYKRKREIITHIDELKQQLKKDKIPAIKTLACHAEAINEAKCIATVPDESFKKALDNYREIIQTGGDYENPAKIWRGESLKGKREEIKAKLHEKYDSEDKFQKDFINISKLSFLKGSSITELSITPFQVSSKEKNLEDRWIKTIEDANIPAETALLLGDMHGVKMASEKTDTNQKILDVQ
jgi:hypothetical protein